MYVRIDADSGRNRLRLVSLSDIHFPFHDRTALELALAIIQDARPDIAVLNGDIFDHYGVSRFAKTPIREAGFKYELYACTRLFHLLYQRLKACGVSRVIFIEGNHEYRLDMFQMLNAKALYGHKHFELPRLYEFPPDVEYVKRESVPKTAYEYVSPEVVFGRLHILHGDMIRLHHSTVNVARSLFLKTLVPMVVGHHHRCDSYTQPDYEGKLHGCWVQGCLCLIRPHYDGGRLFNQGMVLVDLFPDGMYNVDNIKFICDVEKRALMAAVDGMRYSVPILDRSDDGPPDLPLLWTGVGCENEAYHFTSF